MEISIDTVNKFIIRLVKKSVTEHAEITGQNPPENGVASFKINGWTLYSYEELPSELEALVLKAKEKGADALGKKDDAALIQEKNPLFRIIAEKQMGTHNYRVYLDYRLGSMNRQILMCDEKWICTSENNIGELMAFAEYLNVHEKFGAFEKLDGGGWLEVSINEFVEVVE